MSTDIICRKEGHLLLPSMPNDAELLESLSDGEYRVAITKPRGLKNHKRYFTLLNVIFDYMPEEKRTALGIFSVEALRKRIMIELGRCSMFIAGEDSPAIPAGTVFYEPESISFAKMDELEFRKLFSQTIDIALARYVPMQTNDSLMMAAENAVLRYG